ncbi:MAG: hypothetical protein CO128_10780 [Ignavibacteriales bacterium CG_4_9_14_3_um_filter_30_11]|nr:MAG: hypothetical protein CO128_10780 [Ignavibacteriales bacterium CG_4_9_14_3_um_filter_30_11]
MTITILRKFRWLVLLIFIFTVFTNAQNYKIKNFNFYGKQITVKENIKTGSPHRIYNFTKNYKDFGFHINMDKKLKAKLTDKIMEDFSDLIKVKPKYLKLKSVETNELFLSVTLQQYYNDIPVWQSEVGYTIDNKGNLLSLGADIYPKIKISTNPGISSKFAEETALKDMKSSIERSTVKTGLLIYPDESKEIIEYYLTWKVEIKDSVNYDSITYFIDANNGKIIKSINQVMQSGWIGGYLKYKYFPQHYYDTQQVLNISDMKITIYDGIGVKVGDIYPNSSGYFYYPNSVAYGYYYVHVELKNSYVDIRDKALDILDPLHGFVQWVTSGLTTAVTPSNPYTPINKTWDGVEGTNMYYHVNFAHDYYKNTFSFNWMDYSMVVIYDPDRGDVNAQADGSTILFGSQNGQKWARSSDVIYHEYTHNVISSIYGGFIRDGSSNPQAAAMDEGLADFFACNLNNDPILGESVGLSRNLNNTLIYNPNENIYVNGKVIGGACWDLRGVVGKSIVEKLVFNALGISPRAYNFADFLENIYLADDLLYGNANTSAIAAAFNNHNIVPEVLTASISGPSILNAYQIGTWTVTTQGGVPPYSYAWSYYIPCGAGVPAAPCGYWNPVGQTSNQLSRYDTKDFILKCVITDNDDQQTAVTQNVIVGSLPKIVDKNNKSNLPTDFVVYPNYPNPFNPSTVISFAIPKSEHVVITIFNPLGQLIKEIVNRIYSPGIHKVEFNASELPSGIYYYIIKTGSNLDVKQMILLK